SLAHRPIHPFPTRRSSDLGMKGPAAADRSVAPDAGGQHLHLDPQTRQDAALRFKSVRGHVDGVLRMLEDEGVYCVDVLKQLSARSEEHTSELQSRENLVCR